MNVDQTAWQESRGVAQENEQHGENQAEHDGSLLGLFHAILVTRLAWDVDCLGWCKKRANWHGF
jgi:hypothetical protein